VADGPPQNTYDFVGNPDHVTLGLGLTFRTSHMAGLTPFFVT